MGKVNNKTYKTMKTYKEFLKEALAKVKELMK